MMGNFLSDLQSWYQAQCDGDWEHSSGITLSTLDNPGWSLIVDLEETLLENKAFVGIERVEPSNSWINCSIKDRQFVGYAGPHQLEELVSTFLDWAKTEPNWLAVESETQKEARERADLALWESLSGETGTAECKKMECRRKHIKFSAFCRTHHFEMLRGYLPPETSEQKL